ncbi:MAG: hypothetical protein EOM56_13620 [Deltaproteobacteria bacterium]|nr:hypothetical protein [Deltaproteobacteria bacterium]
MATTLTYAEIAAIAKTKLTAIGMPMQFVRVTAGGVYDPESGGYTGPTETTTSFYGVRTNPTQAEVQAGLFQGVTAVILAPADLAGGSAPTTADKLIYGGQRWDIKEIRSVAPAETVMLYKLGVTATGSAE